jgi:hypothetical protein
LGRRIVDQNFSDGERGELPRIAEQGFGRFGELENVTRGRTGGGEHTRAVSNDEWSSIPAFKER